MAVRDFRLPDLGEGLEEAEVVAWRVAEGDSVELNQVLVEVNTAKALVEIPAPWEGVVARIHAEEGTVVKVGEPLVSIRVGDAPEDAPDALEAAQEAEPEPPVEGEGRPKRRAVLVGYGVDEDEVPQANVRAPRTAEGEDRAREGPVPASPPVRRLAKELGVELASVSGTGPGGRVTREDVTKTAAKVQDQETMAAVEGATERIPIRGTRRLIAEKMTRSVREIPHVTTFLTVDATWLMAFREEVSAAAGERVSPLPIVVRSLVEVCREHPKLNASFDAQESTLVLYRDCHVGIATDTERGLLVTVVRDAGAKGIAEIGREITRLSEAARTGKVHPQEVSGGTITVTNVGTFGAEFGTPIINHPESAILALGVIEPRALVVEDRVEARPAVTLSLSFDHRVLDGAEAGRALGGLAAILESPFSLGALPR
ncbi:MAG: 2-oxo acid dehydrogenase subunit E2 [Actinobacteria bacterium]|nr:2-oxo acid dehydrogenase subunit E2 [Actinomycetota bacterium]